MNKANSPRSNSLHKKRNAKTQTNKILDRITFNPGKHKQKVTKSLRQKLQQKTIPVPKTPQPITTLKFGSFNVNGLDLEASWAVEQILKKRGFDVSYKITILSYLKISTLGFSNFRNFWKS